MGYCNRRDEDDSSDDDERFDLIDRAPEGMAWHLDELEEEQDQTGGSISGIEGLSVTPGGFPEPEGSDDEGDSPSPRVTSPRGISDPEGGSSDGGSSDDEGLDLPLTPGGGEGPQGGDITPLGAEFPHGVKVMSQ